MQKARTIKSTQSAVYGTLKQVSNIILNFILKTVFIYVLGKDYLGINAVFKEMVAVFAVTDLGIGSVLIYTMYEPLAKGDNKRIAALLQFYKKAYCYIALIIGLLGMSVLPFVDRIIHLDYSMPHIHLYYILYVISTVASYATIYRTSILIADQEVWRVHRIGLFVYIAGIILQIVLLITTKNYALYLVIQIAIPVITNYYSGQIAKRLYPEIWNGNERISREDEKEIFHNIKYMLIYKISYTLVNSTDNTLISVLVGTVTAGLYSNYLMLINAVNSIINVIFDSATASIGNLIYTEKDKRVEEVFQDIQTISLIMALVVTVGYGTLLEDILVIWLGKDFLLPAGCEYWIVANMYFTCIMRPVWGFRNAAGMYDQIKWIMPLYALLNILFSVVLTYIFGVIGIFAGTVLSGILTIFWKEPKLIYDKFLKTGKCVFYINVVTNFVITFGSIVIMNFLFDRIPIFGIVGLVVRVVIIVAYCLVVVMSVYGRKPVVKKFFNIVKTVLIGRDIYS